jgi:hypothetical protein
MMMISNPSIVDGRELDTSISFDTEIGGIMANYATIHLVLL